jgi:geranylgeranyl pyrophosphate synthase
VRASAARSAPARRAEERYGRALGRAFQIATTCSDSAIDRDRRQAVGRDLQEGKLTPRCACLQEPDLGRRVRGALGEQAVPEGVERS